MSLETPLFPGGYDQLGSGIVRLLPNPADVANPAAFPALSPGRGGRPCYPGLDGAVVLAAAAAAHFLLSGVAPVPLEAAVSALLTAILGVGALTGLLAHEPPGRLSAQMWLSLAVWASLGCLLWGITVVAQPFGPAFRLWALTWAQFSVIGLIAARAGVWFGAGWLARTGRLARRAAVLDLSGSAGERARRLAALVPEQIRLVGIWSGQQGLEDLVARSGATRIDEVLITSSGVDERMLADALRRLAGLRAGLHVWLDGPLPGGSAARTSRVRGIPVVKVRGAPPSGWRAAAKRAQDVLLGSLILVVFAPVMLLIAAAIRLDSPGPILFRQRRLGFDNKEFVIYKFRSMQHQPDSRRPEPDGDLPQAKRADPRVSRVGGFLRRKSLDELPQILNVVRGDMSLVGPRPHAVAHHYLYAGLIEGYLGRHRMRPGITGWAQVNGWRGETETVEKMRTRVLYDLAYIDNWSLWLDVRILLQTAFLIILDRNAY